MSESEKLMSHTQPASMLPDVITWQCIFKPTALQKENNMFSLRLQYMLFFCISLLVPKAMGLCVLVLALCNDAFVSFLFTLTVASISMSILL